MTPPSTATIAEILDPVPLQLKTSQGTLFVHEMDWPWLIDFLQAAAGHINKIVPADTQIDTTDLTLGVVVEKATEALVATKELTDRLLSKSVREKDGAPLSVESIATLKPRVVLKLIALALQQNITAELIDSLKETGAQFMRVMPLSAPKTK